MSVPRGLFSSYHDPPPARSFEQDQPTLLITWWCTICSAALIIFRLLGRLVRVSTLYRDDKFMALTMIPLFAHQAFVHVVLLFGTNNAAGTEDMDEVELQRRRIGSGMVLGARVTYAAFIWSQKFCITEFYVRLTEHFWERKYEVGLRVVRWTLLATFIGASVSVFVECHPGDKLWQVVPDPGSSCRSGFAPLLTISTLSIFTDALLVLSPLPAILGSSFSGLKKIRLILTVFSLSLACIALTGYKTPKVFQKHGSQQYRSLFAAFEVLTATIVSNATVINSFARDRGTKRRKFSGQSGVLNAEDGQVRMAYWGSDDDLARNDFIDPIDTTAHRVDSTTTVTGSDAHDPPITQPPSPSQEMDNSVLYDVGGLLKADSGVEKSEYEDSNDDDTQVSASSSSVALRDIVVEQQSKQQ